jgi:tRNA pseudouridine32 synthase/23S rRNA pseudouridine746 synthase/23S rRNA pseudouridine1911/1915/1917 synthase
MTGNRPPLARRRHLPGIELLHEDDHILVVDKPSGLLTVSTDRGFEKTLYTKLTEYVRKGNSKSRNRVFIVHRLDRDASGVLVFAKTESAKRALQEGWDQVKKVYLAVVHGVPKEKIGLITSHLIENGVQRVRSTRDLKAGKLSRTGFRVLRNGNGLSLLEVDLLTGRKHQIRVHLSELGHPIVGDRKYDAPATGEHRLALHAKHIAFSHPVTGAALEFETPMPGYFNRLLRAPEPERSRPRNRNHARPKKTRQR